MEYFQLNSFPVLQYLSSISSMVLSVIIFRLAVIALVAYAVYIVVKRANNDKINTKRGKK